MAFDRYKYLKREDGTMRTMPPLKVSKRSTDVFRVYNSDKTRLDRISGDVYENDCYGWLILLANPEYGMEFDIPMNSIVRIPYPLREALSEVEGKLIKSRDVG